jgi:hypothetical protein
LVRLRLARIVRPVLGEDAPISGGRRFARTPRLEPVIERTIEISRRL